MRPCIAAVIGALLFESVACRTPAAPLPAAPAEDFEDHPYNQSCPWTADGCVEDGCAEAKDPRGPVSVAAGPRVVVTSCGPDGPPARMLAEVARELRDVQKLTILRIAAATAECGDGVRKELERQGAPPGRVQVVVRRERYVRFEVAVWNGAPCR